MPETDTTTTTTDDKGGDKPAGDKGGSTTTTSTSGGGGAEDLASLVEKLRTENKEAKREAAALRTKASKLDELEAASKTDLEKANDRATKAERDAESAAKKLMRFEVAAAVGLPMKLAGRIQGDDAKEMREDAEELLKTFGGGEDKGRRRTNANAGDEGGKPSGNMSDWIRGQARRSA